MVSTPEAAASHLAAAPNLFDPAFRDGAHAAYAALRERAPVARIPGPEGAPFLVVTGYDEALTVLTDRRFLIDPENVFSAEDLAELGWVETPLDRNLLNVDPPDHTRLRRLVQQAFTPKFVAGLRSRIEQVAEGLLDEIEDRARETGRREAELIGEFAFPLPLVVIAEMLGVPAADRDKFRDWSDAVVSLANPTHPSEATLAKMHEFAAYSQTLFAEKRRAPADDLISGLVRAEDEDGKLSEQELLSMVLLLLVAGHETTVNLIGSGSLALFEHPDQLARLAADPALLKPAVEELLRFYSPVENSITRWVGDELTLGGETIARGEPVIAVLAAANRDPARFADPDRLDLGREENRHLAFGKGIHLCLGAPLARLEGEIAFGALLRRFPELRLAIPRESLAWRPNFLLRGLTRLPVAF